MRAVEGLHPPVPYATHWAVLAVVLLLLAAAAVTVVLRATRRPRATPAPTTVAAPVVAPTVDLGEIQRGARAELDAVWARHAAGDLDDRGLALAVSATVRRVAAAATGVPADAMALADLAGSGVPQLAGPVAAAVRACYPSAFEGRGGRGTGPGADALLGAAREAVDAWG